MQGRAFFSFFLLILMLCAPWPLHFFLNGGGGSLVSLIGDDGRFAFSFEKYIKSSMAFMRARVWGVASSHVVVGEGSWLYYRGNDIFEDLMGSRRFDSQGIADWFRPFEDKKEFVESSGARYLLVTIPNKSSIEREYLPFALKIFSGVSRYEQLISHKNHGLADGVLHLRDVILASKLDWGEAYWFDDSHWNGYAFRRGLEAVFQRVHSWEPLLDVSEFKQRTDIVIVDYSGDLSNLAGVSEYWPRREKAVMGYSAPEKALEGTTRLSENVLFKDLEPAILKPVVIEREDGYGSALIFHDSFFATAFASENTVDRFPSAYPFRRAVHIWKRPTLDELIAIMDEERFDFVIEVRVERLLHEENFL